MATGAPLGFDPIAEAARQWEAHGWAAAAPGMAMVTSVARVNQILLAQADGLLAPHDLTFARYELLALLQFSRQGELPLGKIGRRLQVHPASVTNAVDRLEQQGFVRRVAHPTDGRAVLARITPAGRRVAKRATAALNEALFEAVPLTTDELGQLFSLLRRVRLDAADFTDGSDPPG